MWNCLCRARLTDQSYKNRYTKDSSLSQDKCQHIMHWPLALTSNTKDSSLNLDNASVYEHTKDSSLGQDRFHLCCLL